MFKSRFKHIEVGLFFKKPTYKEEKSTIKDTG